MGKHVALLLSVCLYQIWIRPGRSMYVGLPNPAPTNVRRYIDTYGLLKLMAQLEHHPPLPVQPGYGAVEPGTSFSRAELSGLYGGRGDVPDVWTDKQGPGVGPVTDQFYDTIILPSKREGKRVDCRGFKFGVWQRKLCQKIRS